MGCGASIQPQDTYTLKVASEGGDRVSSTGKSSRSEKTNLDKKKRVKEKYKAELYDKAQGKSNGIERSRTIGGNQARSKMETIEQRPQRRNSTGSGSKCQGIRQEKDSGGPERW